MGGSDEGTLDDGVTPITKEDIWETPNSYSQYYNNAQQYWENVPATLEGVMGGFGRYSGLDIQGSEEFLLKCLEKLKRPKKKQPYSVSLDCGAGVGRVTKDLLKNYFSEVHLVELAAPLLEEAKKALKDYPSQYFCSSLHTFEPIESYDITWAQWVLGHLTDEDLKQYFVTISNALTPDGFMVVKENVCRKGLFILDKEDSSITRSKDEFERIFKESGLEIVYRMQQRRWPANLYPVWMWALKVKEE